MKKLLAAMLLLGAALAAAWSAAPAAMAGAAPVAASPSRPVVLVGIPGLRWTDVEVMHDSRGRPVLEVRGTAAAAAARLGIRSWHLSLSHDGGMSVAMVVAES